MKKDALSKFLLFVIMIMILLISGCTTTPSPSQTGQQQTQLVTPTIETATSTQATMTVVVPTATPSLKDTPAPMNTIRVEESNLSVFTFSPGWVYRDVPGASGGSWAATNYGAYGFTTIKVDVKFSGTGIALVYHTLPYGGIADVMIDGKIYPSIDMYSNLGKAVTSIIATDLENKQHVLTISPAANYNPAVTFTPEVKKAVITVDAVDITQPG